MFENFIGQSKSMPGEFLGRSNRLVRELFDKLCYGFRISDVLYSRFDEVSAAISDLS